MADVFPRRNLPPDAEQWGRSLETKAVSNERSLEILGQSVQAQNRNTASSLEVLAGQISTLGDQVRDLRGRVSYALDGTGTTQSWTSNQPDNSPWGPTLSFTLPESRVVSLDFSFNATVEGTANNTTTSVFSSMRGMIFVNGSGVGGSRGEVGIIVQVMPAPPVRYDFASSSIICRSLVSLPAGTYTMQGGFNFRSAEAIGSGSAKITASDPNLFVEVLQPAG